VQKLIRAGFGNNNVDTCARVCHSPTGYGLSTTFGTSAGTQDFDSVEHTDVVVVIGANGLGVTEHSQGSTTVIAIANLAMATGNIGRPGVGVNPLRGQNNVQGSCDMGSFPHELPGYRHISGDAVRDQFEAMWNVKLNPEPGLRIPNMFDAAIEGTFMGLYVQGEDILQSDPNTKHVVAALSSNASSFTTSS
jgi:predicted molibdopterin-dependent oxidoreductase YjgC